jgi:hypothetical protein
VDGKCRHRTNRLHCSKRQLGKRKFCHKRDRLCAHKQHLLPRGGIELGNHFLLQGVWDHHTKRRPSFVGGSPVGGGFCDHTGG